MLEGFEAVVCLDVETTGLDSKMDQVIELGAVKAPALGEPVTERLSTLVRLDPGIRVPSKVVELTGITDKMLKKDGMERTEAANALADMLEGRNLVLAYNAQFDMVFVYHLLASAWRQRVLKGIKMLDVLTIYRDRREYPHKLENAIAAYGLDAVNSHRAIDDAEAALKLAAAMESEKDDLDRYINLFGYNPKFGISGQRIGSITYVPQGYDRSRPLYEAVKPGGGAR